jgi:hypothetical protein
MIVALDVLDNEISKSEYLSAISPVRCISIGGFLAVKYLKNRQITTDIDYLLDPHLLGDEEAVQELTEAVSRASVRLDLDLEWFNSELLIFAHTTKRATLFYESIQQNIVLYDGPNLTIYAGKLTWALERKIRRIQNAFATRNRDIDVDDAVSIIHYLKQSGHPLSFEYIQTLNLNGFDVAPATETLRFVAEAYRKKYGALGLVEYVYDSEQQRHRYLNELNEWTWV